MHTDPPEPNRGTPSFGAQMAAALNNTSLGALTNEDIPAGQRVLAAIGGVRGILETVLPGFIFLGAFSILTVAFSWSSQAALWPALVSSLGIAVVFTVIRLVSKSPASQAFGGLIAVAFSAAIAMWTGNARDNYVWGFYTSGGYALAFLLSVLVRWPIVGIIAGFLMNDVSGWRRNRVRFRAAVWLSVLWAAMFALRVIVQLPMYLADNVVGLGITRLIMGWPLYALMLVLSWVVIRAVYPPRPRAERSEVPEQVG